MSQAKSFHDLIAWTSRNQSSRLDQIDAPVLVAWGEGIDCSSDARPRASSPPFRDLSSSGCPGVGHVPMQDDPELGAGVVRRFVSGPRGE